MENLFHFFTSHPFVVFVILFALAFDFLNGFHDAANAIATVVVSKTLTPFQAVLLAGAANVIGYFIFGVAVAKMVGKGVIHIEVITLPLLMAALSGAIIWNIITWLLGLPTSSSHALVGGLVGAAVAAVGFKAIIWQGLGKIFAFIFVAPFLGLIGGFFFTLLVMRIFRKTNPFRVQPLFRFMQLISSTLYSVGHGTNDAQKTMAIIALALYSGGARDSFYISNWIAFACHLVIGLGTFFGGWRIVKTMGTSITKIRTMEGFCAETGAACVLWGTAHFGIPVSTTHVISGAIMGVGTVEHAASVRWVTARRIVWAWIITIPATAACSALSYFLIMAFRAV